MEVDLATRRIASKFAGQLGAQSCQRGIRFRSPETKQAPPEAQWLEVAIGCSDDEAELDLSICEATSSVLSRLELGVYEMFGGSVPTWDGADPYSALGSFSLSVSREHGESEQHVVDFSLSFRVTREYSLNQGDSFVVAFLIAKIDE